MQKTSFIRSPLKRWVGSKYDFLPEIYKLVPRDIVRTVEPFCGSAVFTFNVIESTRLAHLREKDARVISDINSNIYHLFHWIKSHPIEVYDKVKEYAVLHSEGFYKSVVSLHNGKHLFDPVYPTDDVFESDFYSACEFLYLHYACFNGLYRQNSKGEFNVPIGRDTKGDLLKISICDTTLIDTSYELETINILMMDYHKTIKTFLDKVNSKKTLFFLDPPYLNTFSGYDKSSFSLKDHLKLIELCKRIDNEGHYFMLFNSNNILYNSLLSDYRQYNFYRKGSINSDPTKRKKVIEKMYSNC